jgi:hypothetical protein
MAWSEARHQADPGHAQQNYTLIQTMEEIMIVLLVASLLGDTLAPDVEPSSIWHLAGIELLFDALAIVLLVALIRKKEDPNGYSNQGRS